MTLVLVTANGCPACDRFKATVLPALQKQINVRNINFASTRAIAFTPQDQKYDSYVTSVPTILLDRGNKIEVYLGARDANAIASWAKSSGNASTRNYVY